MTIDRVVVALLKPGKQREFLGARSLAAKNSKVNFVIVNFEFDDDLAEPFAGAAQCFDVF
jgi:hypothetical protein